MLETKDFIDIKMQDETRYKKPIGIYWAQAFSNYFLGDIPYGDKIWFIEGSIFDRYYCHFY